MSELLEINATCCFPKTYVLLFIFHTGFFLRKGRKTNWMKVRPCTFRFFLLSTTSQNRLPITIYPFRPVLSQTPKFPAMSNWRTAPRHSPLLTLQESRRTGGPYKRPECFSSTGHLRVRATQSLPPSALTSHR